MKRLPIHISADRIASFCEQHHISKLSLFGSVLREDFGPESDVDVLVEFEEGFVPGFIRLHALEKELSTLMENRELDLVTPKSLNHRIRDQILNEARIQYVKEE